MVNNKLSAVNVSKSKEFSGKSIRRLLLQAVRSLRTNKFDDATMYLNEVLTREPDNARGNAILFTTYYKSEQFDEARNVGAKAAELNPRSQYILNNQACLQISKQQFSDAKDLLNQLIESYGETSQWLYNLGLAFLNNNELKQAASHFMSALNIEPNHQQSALQLSALQVRLGLHEDSAETLNLLRLITASEAITNANYIRHSTIYGLMDESSLEQEIALWGDQFIPKNRSYPSQPLPIKGKPLKMGFIIGDITELDWSLIISPLLEQLTANKHEITVYWHKKTQPKTNFSLLQCRQLSDTDFAKLIRKQNLDALIDVGGMHIQTRERALGLQIAKKQFGWLQHPGFYSSNRVKILDNHLDSHAFAISVPQKFSLPKVKKVGENVIAAIGCSNGLSEENIQLWAKVLIELPKHKILIDAVKQHIQDRLIDCFNSYGVDSTRIKFTQNISCKSGDVVLTNLFNNPKAQACLAHAQGAAIFTLKGQLFPAQQTSRLLEQTHNDQFISYTKKEYIDNIVSFIKKSTAYKLKKSEILNVEGFSQLFVESLYQ